jgi:hypothetical protein
MAPLLSDYPLKIEVENNHERNQLEHKEFQFFAFQVAAE